MSPGGPFVAQDGFFWILGGSLGVHRGSLDVPGASEGPWASLWGPFFLFAFFVRPWRRSWASYDANFIFVIVVTS